MGVASLSADPSSGSIPAVGIVGAGFAGTLTAVQLARRASLPLRIRLYDGSGRFARGVAYSTEGLLNVMAKRMGAFPDAPEDFYRWLETGAWRRSDPQMARLAFTGDSFLPRRLYGRYLEDVLAGARESGQASIATVAKEVVSAQPQGVKMLLTLQDGAVETVDACVLATGNLPPCEHIFAAGITSPRYIRNPWQMEAGSLLARAEFSRDDDPVVIIGTGLTMIDLVLLLRKHGYRGKIVAVSRHGLLPQPHIPAPAYEPFLPVEAAPNTAIGLARALRGEVRRARASMIPWQAVVDALRTDTPALWSRLPLKEKRRFLRLRPYWSTHRHRMPPECAQFIAMERASGALTLLAGGIKSMTEKDGRLLLQLRGHGKAPPQILAAGHVINCAGPDLNVAKSESPLLRALCADGFLLPNVLGMGAEVTQAGEEAGFYLAGPLQIGQWLEATAVPEVRQQAAAAAQAVLARLARSVPRQSS